MESGTVAAAMGLPDDEAVQWIRQQMRDKGYTAETCRIVKTDKVVMGVVK